MRKFKAVEAVQSICFDIAPAEVVGFLGPNGAGKTTTLKMLSGLLHPTSGRATVLGYTPWERRADDLRAMTLVMGQRNRLSWDITAQARIRGFLQEYNRRTGAVKCIRQEPSMLRIHQRLWQVNWAEQWQYRANLIMYLLYWLVSPVVYLSVWTAVATAQGDVQGLTANDFVLYYLTLLIVDQLTSEITIHIFGYKIQDGSLSSELIRPIHPILTNTLVYNLAFKVLVLGGMLPVWGVLWFLFQPDFGTVTWGNIALAAPAVLLGFALNFLIGASLTCLAFWTTRVWSLAEFYWASVSLFSGQFVPLMLLPTGVQTIAAFLPFRLFRYFPIQIVLGRLTPGEIVQGYVVGGVWLLVAIVLFNWVWREGVKRYSAVAA